MQLIAHRGLVTNDIKENTMEAFLNAINNGYDGIELDIRVTKDNNIVVIHNQLIDLTSNGHGSINKYTYKELLKYNFGSKNIKSSIPLLSQVIKKIHNKIIIIELKEKIPYNLLDKILSKNNSNEYYLASFYKSNLENIDKNKYKVGLIDAIFNIKENIKNYNFIMILNTLFNESIYNYLKNIEVQPIIYRINKNINLKNKENVANLKYII